MNPSVSGDQISLEETQRAYLDVSDVIAADLPLIKVEEDVRYHVGSELLITFSGLLIGSFLSGFVNALKEKLFEHLVEKTLEELSDFTQKALKTDSVEQQEELHQLMNSVVVVVKGSSEADLKEAIEEGTKMVFEALKSHNFPEDKAKDRAERIAGALTIVFTSGGK